jgi:PHD/YefM family antitoxin component YafN of YafNO toxin-antitoxin module
MRERQDPMTKTMNASAVRDEWSQIIKRVSSKQARILVEENGIPVAVIIAPEDLALLNRLAAEWDEPFRALDRSQAAFRDIPSDEREREVTKAVDEARAGLRAEREHAADTR